MTIANTRILVVDDDLRLRDLLNRYLSEQGFSVHIAQDAVAMDKLRGRERFDLIVLDLMMPGEDGLSVCRRLRGANDTIPIIMLTAKGDDVDRIVGLEMGADDICPSRSIRANWWRASMPCCAGAPRPRPPAPRRWRKAR